MSNIDYIIVGLGNPGRQYENTRHNSGFRALDHIANNLGTGIDREKFKSLVCDVNLSGKRVLLLKPQTYMNLSGQAVTEAISFYKVPPENVLLIFDDISLPVGKIRIRKSGSHGGQNGVKNIIALSGSDNFPRIRIGIGEKPSPAWDLSDWVLSKFSKSETDTINETLCDVQSAAEMIVSGEIESAMNKFN
ncbi:MAG: aminoacyl-tRNA hydrolase [Clostridia bacterium]|nr:aminoacyl-tRNA hydrolase [Clostridia bacterium]MBR2734765.1 aminoacyl-tRNA hydrolase [Clostridia bacterium]